MMNATEGCDFNHKLGSLRNPESDLLCSFVRPRFTFKVPMREVVIESEACVRIVLRLRPQVFRIFGFTLGQHLEPRLVFEELTYVAGRRSGIEYQRIFADDCAFGIVAV